MFRLQHQIEIETANSTSIPLLTCSTEFVYSDKEISLETAEEVIEDIASVEKDLTPARYPHLTPENVKLLKYAHLVCGEYLDMAWFRIFITIGTFYLANRAQHARYKPLAAVKVNVQKPSSELPALAPQVFGPELPPAMAAAREARKNAAGVAKEKEPARASAPAPAPAVTRPKFGGPTKMQLDILEAAIAQNHPVTQTEEFKSLSLIMQCYAAQATGITATPIVPAPIDDADSDSIHSSSSIESASSTGTNTPLCRPGPVPTLPSRKKLSTMEKEIEGEDKILAELASDVLKTAAAMSYETPTNLSDLMAQGIEALEASLSNISLNIEKSVEKGKQKIRRALSTKSTKKLGKGRVEQIQLQEGVNVNAKQKLKTGPMGKSVTTLLDIDEYAVREPEAADDFQPLGGFSGSDSQESLYPQSTYGQGAMDYPLNASAAARASNLTLDSIVESMVGSDAVGSVADENASSNDSEGGWGFMKRASTTIKNVTAQSDADKMRSQRRQSRAKFEIED